MKLFILLVNQCTIRGFDLLPSLDHIDQIYRLIRYLIWVYHDPFPSFTKFTLAGLESAITLVSYQVS